jgi:hypothetical protein
LARLWFIWRGGRLDANAIADILNFAAFDRAVLQVIARMPFGSSYLGLGWITLRMPPFSLPAMVQAWWRAQRFKWFDRGSVERKVDAVNLAVASPPRELSR